MRASSGEVIDELRRHFIVVAAAVAFMLVGSVIATLNIASWWQGYQDLDQILDVISNYDGTLPSHSVKGLGNLLSPEGIKQLRYFSVIFDKDEQVITVNVDNIYAIDSATAIEISQQYLSGAKNGAFQHSGYDYVYQRTNKSKGVLVVVLECTSEFSSMRRVTLLSVISGLIFTLVFIGFLSIVSKQAMKPIAKNVQSQREFITNASHELKTPVAIIQANAEFLEMKDGANEWTGAIKRQTERLTQLINRLVALARLQETGTGKLKNINASQIVADVSSTFKVVAESEGRTFESQIAPCIEIKAEPQAFRELVNILLDNATKYCDKNGHVSVAFDKIRTKVGARARLTIKNSYAQGKDQDFNRFFERFWRKDDSHSSNSGGSGGVSGSGIGLSMATQIVTNFHGKIGVSWKAGTISVDVTL